MRYEIRTGDALGTLKTLRANSVQCCVTSPPYWGLRDYGIEGRAWGGDPTHQHEWGGEVRKHATNHTDKRRWNHARNGRGEEQPVEKRPGWKRQHVGQGNFCECGAWFGVLGLEPTPDLYVEHMVELFQEVRRVLKNDGTLWLNLGDCYATGGGKVGSAHAGGERGKKYAEMWGYRGGHESSPKHRQVPDSKSPNAGIPTFQPNRMPIDGLKPKDLVGIPWRVAFALQADGWYLRSDIIWAKNNPIPESVTDRPTRSHEYLFLLTKSRKYLYDHAAIKEPLKADTLARYERGRSNNHKWADGGPGGQTIARTFDHMRRSGNKERKLDTPTRPNDHLGTGVPWQDSGTGRNRRTVWSINTRPFKGAHFATFPPKLVEPCVLAGSRPGDVVLDPFNGAATTGLVALQHNRRYLGIEMNPEYVAISHERLAEVALERKQAA